MVNRRLRYHYCGRLVGGREGGFALLDVLVGGIVLSIALTAIFGLSSRALSAQVLGEKRQQASMLLDLLLNQVLAIGPRDYSSTFSLNGTADAPFENFQYEITIDDEGIGHPYGVTATVWWYMGSRRYEETVETKIAQPENDDNEVEDRKLEQPVNRDQ